MHFMLFVKKQSEEEGSIKKSFYKRRKDSFGFENSFGRKRVILLLCTVTLNVVKLHLQSYFFSNKEIKFPGIRKLLRMN